RFDIKAAGAARLPQHYVNTLHPLDFRLRESPYFCDFISPGTRSVNQRPTDNLAAIVQCQAETVAAIDPVPASVEASLSNERPSRFQHGTSQSLIVCLSIGVAEYRHQVVLPNTELSALFRR